MPILTNTIVPGHSEAVRINSDLLRLGIKDVELMYDKDIKMWAAVQTFKPSGSIVLMNTAEHYATEPNVMFWIKTNEGAYRTPSNQDLSDIMAIVQRAQVWFKEGSDKMVDKIEAKEKADYDQKRREQSERIRYYAKPLKKAIQKELN